METLIKMERSEPKRRLPLSDGAIYALTLIAVVGAVIISYDLAARFALPRGYVQLSLYALLALIAYWIYRTRLLGYRYTLTNRTLRIDRLVGARAHFILELRLSELLPPEETPPAGRALGLYAGGRKQSRVLAYRRDGKIGKIRISAGEEFMKELNAQWEKNR